MDFVAEALHRAGAELVLAAQLLEQFHLRPPVQTAPRTSTAGRKTVGHTERGGPTFASTRGPSSDSEARVWVARFGPLIARRLRRRRGPSSGTWHLDEMFVKIAGRTMYLWRAVDSEGEVLDMLIQSRRDKAAALRFMRKLLKSHG